MALNERVAVAREKAAILSDRCLEVERIQANNRHLIYRQKFRGPLYQSRASFAYEALRLNSFAFGIVRVTALWDVAKEDRICIPDVVKLIDHPDIVAELRKEFLSDYSGEFEHLLADGEVRRRFERGLRHAQQHTARIERSRRLKALKRHRDKFLAHNLTIESIGPKFGYERKLLWASERIVNGLRSVLSRSSIDYADSRRMVAESASEFWEGLSWESKA